MNKTWQLRSAVLYLTLGVPLAASCAREANTLADDEPGSTGGKAGAGGTSAKAGTGPGASGSTSAFGGTSSKAGSGGSAVTSGGGGTEAGGTSSGGTAGGSGGAGGTTGVPADVLARASAVVYYVNRQDSPGIVKMTLFIKNQSADPLPMANVKIRYWFTAEVTPSLHQYYTGKEAQLPQAVFVDDGADSHTLMTFGGGSIVMGGDVNFSEIQLVIDNNMGMFDQTNDFSWSSSTMSSPNPKITLYLQDKLIWGCEPSGACFDDGGAGGAGAGGAGDGEPGAGGAEAGGAGGAP